ncbi:MAG: type II secretion system protein GspK [Planctomycetota bacterium]|nr:type II secretion system protein GspK [Planctomycetota bacterium]
MLIVTMWILLVLAGLVLVLAHAMRVEGDCSANEVAAMSADAIEQGAIQYVLARVDGLEGQVPLETDTPCEAVPVGDGAFWILRPRSDDDRTYSYGITDEAGKVNLNTATVDMLAKLPGMTAEFAASIVDWRDPDSEVTSGGAESEYYLMLQDPYECKNSPLETVEEVFLVRGASKEILFGQDVNRNGILDAGENPSAFGGSLTTGSRLNRGIVNCVTVYSVEPGTTSTGTPRVYINDAQSPALNALLRRSVSSDRIAGVLDRVRRERPFRNVMDFYFRAGLTIEEFEKVAPEITASRETQRGLINVNTAPKEVLYCLPGLEESDVSALLARRATATTTATAQSTSVAWVAAVLPRAKAIGVGGLITGQTFRFSADIVSIAANGRAFKRCRVVVDAQTSPPRVLYRQDLTHLGWPLSPDIVTTLRSGAPLERVVQTVGKGIGQL